MMLLSQLLLGNGTIAKQAVREVLSRFNSLCAHDIDSDFASLSVKVLQRESTFTLKLYVVFGWIVFSESARRMMLQSETSLVGPRFVRILTRSFIFLLHGLTHGGTPFKTEANLAIMRKLDFFVINMMTVYAHL